MRRAARGGVVGLVLALLGCSGEAGTAGGGGAGGAVLPAGGGASGLPGLPGAAGGQAIAGGAGAGGEGPSAGAGGASPVGCVRPPCPAAFDVLFAAEQLPAFYLAIPDDSFAQLSACNEEGLARDPPPPECDYQPATFHAEYDPAPLDGVAETLQSPELPVGVRLKGRASFRPVDDKPALKVKFTEGQGDRFLGLSRLTLNNLVQDPSGLRERIAYRVYRDAGVQAPLANNARVYVRRGAAGSYEYYGLYANVQTLDRRFVETRFGEVGGEAGNLYDTKNAHYFTDFDRSGQREQAGTAPGAQEARFQLETNDAAPDTSDLTAAIDAVYVEDLGSDESGFLAGVEPVIDVEQWLRVAAAQALVADWDGFAGARNNYKAYRDLVRGKLVLLPWGTDQTFGNTGRGYAPNWHYPLEHQESDRTRALFLLRCLRDGGGCALRYAQAVAGVAATFDTQALLGEIDRAAQQVEDARREDTRSPHDEAQAQASVQHLRHFVEHRLACVGQLLQHGQCQQLACPQRAERDCRP